MQISERHTGRALKNSPSFRNPPSGCPEPTNPGGGRRKFRVPDSDLLFARLMKLSSWPNVRSTAELEGVGKSMRGSVWPLRLGWMAACSPHERSDMRDFLPHGPACRSAHAGYGLVEPIRKALRPRDLTTDKDRLK
jgi:hypothetical protein